MRKKKIIGVLLILLGYSFWLGIITSNPTSNSDIFILAASECVGLGICILYSQKKVDHPQDDNLDEESNHSLIENYKIKNTSIGVALIVISAVAYYTLHHAFQPQSPLGIYFSSMFLSIPVLCMLVGIKMTLKMCIKEKNKEIDSKMEIYLEHFGKICLCFFVIFAIGSLCLMTYVKIRDIKDSTKIEEHCIYAQINYIEHTNGKTNVYIEYKSGNTKKEEIIKNYKESVKEGDWIKVHCKKEKIYSKDIKDSIIANLIGYLCNLVDGLTIFATVIVYTNIKCIEIFLILKELF